MTNWLSLSAEPSAVRWGRASVLSWLKDWGLGHEHLIDAARLIASELLTNAVRYAGAPHRMPGYVGQGSRRLVAVRLRQHGGSLFVDVWDSSVVPPTIRASDQNAEGGRGMALIAELSKKWGAWRVPPEMGMGKVVWAELAIAPKPVTAPEAEPVAIPTPGPGPVAPSRPHPHPLAAPRPVMSRPGAVPVAAPRPGPVAASTPDRHPLAAPGRREPRPHPLTAPGRAVPGPRAAQVTPVTPGPMAARTPGPLPQRVSGGWRRPRVTADPRTLDQIMARLSAMPV
ncbi:ATP-binding protein [Streptomyces virginiae]